MNISEIILISISLAMDAFSVSISKGLNIKNNIFKISLIIALFFSIFQMLMPILGYYLGNIFSNYILKFNNIIASILLLVIGFNMLKDSYHSNLLNTKISIKELIGLSIATSIDAFSIGITFSLFKINILNTIIVIGIITFILSFLGTLIGKIIGNKFEKISEIIGGIVLILMGLKFLFFH